MSDKKIWPQFEENKELLKFFPDFNENELPERDHFYGILTTLYEDEVKQLIANGRIAKAQVKPESREELVEFDPSIWKKSRAWLKWKEKCLKEILINNVATKGRAYHLLKTKSIGKRKKKDVTQHEADLLRFKKKKLVVPFQRCNQTIISFLQKTHKWTEWGSFWRGKRGKSAVLNFYLIKFEIKSILLALFVYLCFIFTFKA